MRDSSYKKARFLLTGLALGVYLLAGLRQIEKPGPFYDETIQLLDSCRLAGTWGRFAVPSQYFSIRVGGRSLPVMWRAGYLGPGKTYLFALVFAIFPPCPETVRITTVLLGLLSLLFVFAFTERLFGRLPASLAVLLLGTDLSYLLLHRMDHGPVAMMTACATGALLFFARWWEDRRTRSLLAGALLLGLGLLEKATFLGFIGALFLAGTLALRGRLWRRIARWPTLPALFAILLGAAPFVYFHLRRPLLLYRLWTAEPSPRSFLEPFRRVLHLAIDTLNGTFEQNLVLGRTAAGAWTPYLMAGAGVLGLALLADRRRRRAVLNARVGFVAAMTALIGGFLFAVPQARSSWHFLMIYPFPQILASVLLAEFLLPTPGARRDGRRWRTGAVMLSVGLVTAVSLRSLGVLHREMDAGRVSPLWSDRIYDLADYLRRRPEQTAVCMDWGFHANLAFLLRGETRIKDRWGDFSGDREQAIRRCHRYLRTGDHCFLFHPLELTIYPQPRMIFEETCRTFGFRPVRVKSFADPGGRTIYEVYETAPIRGGG